MLSIDFYSIYGIVLPTQRLTNQQRTVMVKINKHKEINLYKTLGKKRLMNCFNQLNQMTDNPDLTEPRDQALYDAYMIFREAVMTRTSTGYVLEKE